MNPRNWFSTLATDFCSVELLRKAPLFVGAIFSIALGLTGCSQTERSPPQSASDVVVEVSQLQARKTNEVHYDSLKSSRVTFETTGNVALAETSGQSGILFLEVVETTGFHDYATTPQVQTITIFNGKGKLSLTATKENIPDGQPVPGPPQYEFRRAAVSYFLSAQVVDDSKAGEEVIDSSIARVRATISPTRVLKAADGRSYEAHTDLAIEGLGSLQDKHFVYYFQRITLESPISRNVGTSGRIGLLVVDGVGQQTIEDFLSLTTTYDEKPLDEPPAPRYEYQHLGYDLIDRATVSVK